MFWSIAGVVAILVLLFIVFLEWPYASKRFETARIALLHLSSYVALFCFLAFAIMYSSALTGTINTNFFQAEGTIGWVGMNLGYVLVLFGGLYLLYWVTFTTLSIGVALFLPCRNQRIAQPLMITAMSICCLLGAVYFYPSYAQRSVSDLTWLVGYIGCAGSALIMYRSGKRRAATK